MDERPSQPPMPEETPGLQKIVSAIPVDHYGTSVHLRGWCIDDCGDRPPVVIVHDLGETADQYRATAEAFVAGGYTTYAFDLRGHGRSGRRMGHAPSFSTLVKDLLQVAAWVRHKEKGRAPVILGQGIGALVTLEFTKHHGSFCKAAVLSAPCLELTPAFNPVAQLALRALAEMSPTARVPAWLCPRFARDLGHLPRLTAVFAHELLLAVKRAEAKFIEYHGSVLILCPEKDAVVSYGHLKKSAAIHVEHNLQIADLPACGHQVFTGEDAPRDAALKVILPWLDRVVRGVDGGPRLQGASRVDQRPGADAPSPEARPGATKL